MTALSDVRPEELVRAAAGCGGLADELGDATVRLSAAATPEWVTGPAEGYGRRLGRLQGCLRLMASSFEEAADALLAFSRVLREVRALAEQARQAGFDAGRLRQDRLRPPGDPLRDVVLAPMGPAEQALTEQARLLQDEAARRHAKAVLDLVTTLEALATRVPAAPGHARWRRTGHHLAEGAKGPVEGLGHLVESLFTSLPGLGTAHSRHEGRQVLEDAAKGWLTPWQAFEDVYQELHDHQYGQAAGAVGADLVLRKAGARGRKVELFGAHDDMHLAVLRALRRDSAGAADAATEWVAERAQAEFLAELHRLRALPLPGVEELVRQGADLIQHEAYGGHTILKHVGRDADWLRHRQQVDDSVRDAVSSFRDLDEAQAVVAAALAAKGQALRDWERSGEAKLELQWPLKAPVGVVVEGNGVQVAATRVIMRLERTGTGAIVLVTAFLQ